MDIALIQHHDSGPHSARHVTVDELEVAFMYLQTTCSLLTSQGSISSHVFQCDVLYFRGHCRRIDGGQIYPSNGHLLARHWLDIHTCLAELRNDWSERYFANAMAIQDKVNSHSICLNHNVLFIDTRQELDRVTVYRLLYSLVAAISPVISLCEEACARNCRLFKDLRNTSIYSAKI